MAVHPLNRGSVIDDQVIWSIETGWPNSVAPILNRKIGALSRHIGFHSKIGITNDPVRRWRQSYHSYGWYRMYVIYKSTSHAHVGDLESLIIQRFRSEMVKSPGWYYNKVDGRGGRIPQQGPNYLYLVVAPKWSRILTPGTRIAS
jgi:hypothetical protein